MAATRWRTPVAHPVTAQQLSGATESAARYQPPKKMYSHIVQRKRIRLSSDEVGVRIKVGNSNLCMARNVAQANAKKCNIYECPKHTANVGVISVTFSVVLLNIALKTT